MEKNKLLVGLVSVCSMFSLFVTGCKKDNPIKNDGGDEVPNGEVTGVSQTVVSPTWNENGYYESCRGLKGNALLNALTALTSSKQTTQTSYDSLRNHYLKTDKDLYESDMVNGYYTGNPFPFSGSFGSSGGQINREHVWCQSYLVSDTKSNAGADLYNVHASEVKINGTRGDLYYETVNTGTTAKEYLSSTNGVATEALYNSNAFDPHNSFRGDVARSIFYVATRYAASGYTVSNSPSKSSHSMGKLSSLLEWNKEYIPSFLELQRNAEAEKIQGTRNPFIDHPEFVSMIWDSSYTGAGALVDTNVSGKRVTELTLSGNPAKRQYNAGETFDPTGLVVTAHYSDNTTKVVDNQYVRFVESKTFDSKVTNTSNMFYCYYEGLRVGFNSFVVGGGSTGGNTDNGGNTNNGGNSGTGGNTSSAGNLDQIISNSQLVAGMKFVLACDEEATVCGSLSGKYFAACTANGLFGTNKLNSLPDGAEVFTLSGSDGAWEFTAASGSKVGATALKNLSVSGGTTTWDIKIATTGDAVFSSTNSAWGMICYNNSSPRFLNYSGTNETLRPIQMFKVA